LWVDVQERNMVAAQMESLLRQTMPDPIAIKF
jgi:hypothetical protein